MEAWTTGIVTWQAKQAWQRIRGDYRRFIRVKRRWRMIGW